MTVTADVATKKLSTKDTFSGFLLEKGKKSKNVPKRINKIKPYKIINGEFIPRPDLFLDSIFIISGESSKDLLILWVILPSVLIFLF